MAVIATSCRVMWCSLRIGETSVTMLNKNSRSLRCLTGASVVSFHATVINLLRRRCLHKATNIIITIISKTTAINPRYAICYIKEDIINKQM